MAWPMRFTTRDVMWLTALAAVVAWSVQAERSNQSRIGQLERRMHKVDQDIHGHLFELSSRVVVLEGWADSQDEKHRDIVQIELALQALAGDCWAHICRMEAEAKQRETKRPPANTEKRNP